MKKLVNRVQELYEVIKNAEKELNDIRTHCQHTKHIIVVASGEEEHICDYCGKFLGEYKIFDEWLPNYTTNYLECCYGDDYLNIKGRNFNHVDLNGEITEIPYTKEDEEIVSKKLELFNNKELNTSGNKPISEKEFRNLIKDYL